MGEDSGKAGWIFPPTYYMADIVHAFCSDEPRRSPVCHAATSRRRAAVRRSHYRQVLDLPSESSSSRRPGRFSSSSLPFIATHGSLERPTHIGRGISDRTGTPSWPTTSPVVEWTRWCLSTLSICSIPRIAKNRETRLTRACHDEREQIWAA